MGESLEVQNNICEIKLRADRRMGEMLKIMDKNKGAMGLGSNQFRKVRSKNSTTPTLKDMGITKNESSLYQKMADIPEEKWGRC